MILCNVGEKISTIVHGNEKIRQVLNVMGEGFGEGFVCAMLTEMNGSVGICVSCFLDCSVGIYPSMALFEWLYCYRLAKKPWDTSSLRLCLWKICPMIRGWFAGAGLQNKIRRHAESKILSFCLFVCRPVIVSSICHPVYPYACVHAWNFATRTVVSQSLFVNIFLHRARHWGTSRGPFFSQVEQHGPICANPSIFELPRQ